MGLGDPPADHAPDPLLELMGIDHTVGQRTLELDPDLVTHGLEHLGILVEAAGLDLGTGDDLAARDVNRREDRDEALVAEHAPR